MNGYEQGGLCLTGDYQDPELERIRDKLLHHPVYHRIASTEDLRTYAEYHVFAVWDFMSLLKRLQADLTGLQVPWCPRGREPFTRFVNEIVMGEESDEVAPGQYQSHFCLYIEAMHAIGADTSHIVSLIEHLQAGLSWVAEVDALPVDERVKDFLRFDLRLALNAPSYEVAAAFFYGREDIIPEMFLQIVEKLGQDPRLERFRYYLERHIEVDSDTHGPLAHRLLVALCDNDPRKVARAGEIAAQALAARIRLFDAIADKMAWPA
jgi:hypothetical protein